MTRNMTHWVTFTVTHCSGFSLRGPEQMLADLKQVLDNKIDVKVSFSPPTVFCQKKDERALILLTRQLGIELIEQEEEFTLCGIEESPVAKQLQFPF